MRPDSITITPIVAVPQAKLEELKSRPDYHDEILGDIPEVGSVGNKCTDPVYTVTGHCDYFDLSKGDDRVKYADIRANIAAGTSYELLWEERMATDNGLVVVLTYLEYVLAHHSESLSVNIKEFKQ